MGMMKSGSVWDMRLNSQKKKLFIFSGNRLIGTITIIIHILNYYLYK